jgi:asparagine synthase (glutamine-hydrolysing)
MCGIVAIFSPQKPVSEKTLGQAVLQLQHRGPEGSQLWVADHHRIGLAHARLAIIDPENGDQPIANEDRCLHIVVNGEFYDYERARRELTQRGHRMRTGSDSEIALHLYEESGTQCLHQLRGEYAFVLWDERNQMLFAARDRFGIKPLFYAVHEGVLYIASEVKALFAAGIPARWDREGFYHMADCGQPISQTLYDGVKEVPPGHYLVATAKYLEIHKYWDFDFPRMDEPTQAQGDAEWIEMLRAELNDAVRVRLRADTPIGFYLSGGLDSSAILAIAADQLGKPIRTFTVAFSRPEYNEEIFAREMANHIGAEYCPIPVRQSDLAEHFEDSVWHAETICGNANGVARYLLSRKARDEGYKVVLTGEGSDEIFGGYAHNHNDIGDSSVPNVSDPVRRLLSVLETTGSFSKKSIVCLEPFRQALGVVPSWLEAGAGHAGILRDLFEDDLHEELSTRDGVRVFLNSIDVEGQLAGRSALHQSQYLWAKTVFQGNILPWLSDRTDMAHSIESRVPFLDDKVVRLVSKLPISVQFREGVEKFALREAVRSILPERISQRRKHSFLAPPLDQAEDHSFNVFVQDMLRGDILRNMPFFNKKRVLKFLDLLPKLGREERATMDVTLISVLSACVLNKRYALQA